MFSKILKEFFLKKIVNKRLSSYRLNDSDDKVETIGIIVDETYFTNKDKLISALLKKGFNKEQLTILVFKEKVKAKEVIEEPFFSLKNITISGKINKAEVEVFVGKKFDLLINYYDEPKAVLNMVAKKSAANFKVGFSGIDKRINHLIIASDVDAIDEFVEELFKYLKILNKI